MLTIRVLLVDDHPVIRMGIRNILEKATDIVLVGEAACGEEALRLAGKLHPDVLLLDMELPDLPGPEVARRLLELDPEVKILGLSAYDDEAYVRGLIDAGATGYLTKEEAPELILKAVRGVANGDTGWYSHRAAAKLQRYILDKQNGEIQLSSRELEALRLVVAGKTNDAIATEMQISIKTVEKYMDAIFHKTGCSSRVEAAVWAVKNGLA